MVEDDDLPAYIAVWNAIMPAEPADASQQRERRSCDVRMLYVLAQLDGAAAGCGFAGPSQSEGRGCLSPRVLPDARRRGVGTALLQELTRHLATLGFETASAHVDGADEASLASTDPDTRSGFVLDAGPQEDKEICDLAIFQEIQLPGLNAPVELAAYWSDLEQAAVVPTTYSLRVALNMPRQAAEPSVRSRTGGTSIRAVVLSGCNA